MNFVLLGVRVKDRNRWKQKTGAAAQCLRNLKAFSMFILRAHYPRRQGDTYLVQGAVEGNH